MSFKKNSMVGFYGTWYDGMGVVGRVIGVIITVTRVQLCDTQFNLGNM
jgi:hypothetical protein